MATHKNGGAPDEAAHAVTSPGITLDIADATQLYELFKNVKLADTHFHSCQSAQFRQHLQCVYKAPAVSDAFDKLKTALDATKGA